jgi:hypothetical protein
MNFCMAAATPATSGDAGSVARRGAGQRNKLCGQDWKEAKRVHGILTARVDDLVRPTVISLLWFDTNAPSLGVSLDIEKIDYE